MGLEERMSRTDFGYILRQLRHDRGETLEQVSDSTGLSVAMLSRVERNERLPSPESVEALARHFDLPIDYLMSETIARRLFNRYGEESATRAAEHLSREPLDLDLLAGPMDEEETDSGHEETRGRRSLASRGVRNYGPFRERDILAALGTSPAPRSRAAGPSPSPAEGAAPPAGVAASQADSAASIPDDIPLGLLRIPDEYRNRIDPATQRVLRAATEASEAATLLASREIPDLSRAARLQLVDRVSLLASHAADLLHVLAADPDRRVRDAAREALDRLPRSAGG